MVLYYFFKRTLVDGGVEQHDAVEWEGYVSESLFATKILPVFASSLQSFLPIVP